MYDVKMNNKLYKKKNNGFSLSLLTFSFDSTDFCPPNCQSFYHKVEHRNVAY